MPCLPAAGQELSNKPEQPAAVLHRSFLGLRLALIQEAAQEILYLVLELAGPVTGQLWIRQGAANGT